MEKKILFQGEEIGRALNRMAHEVLELKEAPANLILVGIRSRGGHLVRRMARAIEAKTGRAPDLATIDVTAFRDDIDRPEQAKEPPPVDAAISVDEKTVVLVDDVINTGRTVRAALSLLSRLGKPKRVIVAALVDRGNRELPLRADIVGKNVQVGDSERVNVLVQEYDGIDQVTVTPRSSAQGKK
ncbi:MAG: bifunctional pyr operon transcriptional regulator/uracil phosphoribosyltransferase PyrR [Candidatus Binatia bacterium]